MYNCRDKREVRDIFRIGFVRSASSKSPLKEEGGGRVLYVGKLFSFWM